MSLSDCRLEDASCERIVRFVEFVEAEDFPGLMGATYPYPYTCVGYQYGILPFPLCEGAADGDKREGHPRAYEHQGVVVDSGAILADLSATLGEQARDDSGETVEADLFAIGCLGDAAGDCSRGLALLYLLSAEGDRSIERVGVFAIQLDYRDHAASHSPMLSLKSGSGDGEFEAIVAPWMLGEPIQPTGQVVFVGASNSPGDSEYFDTFYYVEP